MKTPDPQDRWFELFGAAADGTLDSMQNKELQDILRTEPEARRLWFVYNDLECGLVEWLSQKDHDAVPAPSPVRTGIPWRKYISISIAAAAALALAFALFTRETKPSGVELTILENHETILESGPAIWNLGEKITLSRLDLTSGDLSFSPAPGTFVTATAPVSIELVSPQHIRVLHGKVTAEATPGFTVETLHARLVDLGTQFGVEVVPGEDTRLVVFDGQVEVHEPTSKSKSPIATITEGQALGIGDKGQLSQVNSILTSGTFDGWSIARPPSDTAIISAVSDNVEQLTGNRYYPIFTGGLAEGVRAFSYQKNTPRWWSANGDSLPSWLQGADFVQTLQRELNNPDLQITITVARPCNLFIFHESKSQPPQWLQNDFKRTGTQLALSPEPPPADLHASHPGQQLRVYDVWKKRIDQPGIVRLGPIIRANQHAPPHYMYGIAAKETGPNAER